MQWTKTDVPTGTFTQYATQSVIAHFPSALSTVYYLGTSWLGWWGNTMKVGFDFDESNPGAQDVTVSIYPLSTVTTTRVCSIYSMRIGY